MKYNTKALKWVLLITIPVAIASVGCQKFLDRKPLQATLSDLNQGGVEGLALGLYGAIRNPDEGGAAWGHIPYLAIHSFRDDDAMKGSSPSDGADWAVIYDQFQYSKDHWSTNIYYERKYKMIDHANILIHTVDSLKLTDPASLVNLAEGKFFRALSYFDLVRTYGKVRKIDFPVTTNAQVNSLPKSDESVIYGLIDADLQYAVAHLPLNWKNASGQNKYPGRLTRGAAQTLLAKTMMYRQQWAGALGLLQQVIASGEYGLAKYNLAYNEEGENGKESIFEIQAYTPPGASGTAQSLYSFFATSQGVRGSGDWDLGWGWNTPTPDLVAAYEAGDPRKDYTILYTGQSDDPAHGGYGRTLPTGLPRAYWNKKAYVDPKRQQETGDIHGAGFLNQRILRYADVLLMAAEAANEIGGAANQTLAVNYLEQVRVRARDGNNSVLPFVAFVSQTQMRTAIKQERRVEFAMEGERFFDLVRWGDAVNVLGPLGYQARNKYLPLPQPVIDQSGGALVQNPDYP